MRPALAALALAAAACGEVRELPARPVDWESDVRPLLEARCAQCHAAPSPAGGWSVARVTDALACVELADGGVAAGGRLRRALERDDHRPYVDDVVRAAVTRWLAGPALPRRGAMHDPGFVDPRSPSFHGRSLRAARWAPMLDATRQEACGRCHAGAPARPADAGAPAPGATPCTDCHDRPGGALACDTCHPAARRWTLSPCFAPTAAPADAHARHVNAGSSLVEPLVCTACHPSRDATLASGPHGDGHVDIRFDEGVAGPGARFEAATARCAVRCHAATPGAPSPQWREPQRGLSCAGCHATPPAGHWPGPCTTCHIEPNARGDALTAARLHLNGRVDPGDGSGTCAACHGRDGDPWPLDATHQRHHTTALTSPIGCGECHEVPATVLAAGHLDDRGAADVRLGSRASLRGARPSYADRTCARVACHGEGVTGRVDARVTWGAPGPLGCNGCHDVPPPYPHSVATGCEVATCHGGSFERVDGALQALPAGRATHIDGFANAGAP